MPQKTSWPTAAFSALALPAPAGSAANRGEKAQSSVLPGWAQAVADAKGTYQGPAKVNLRVLGHEAATAAGINGVVLSVVAAAPGSGAVRVGLDYQGFAQAYGGNYGSRLRLVSMPACVLTAPTDTDCRRITPLTSSTNDLAAQSVSAQITVSADSAPTVLAAVADAAPEGAGEGTYAATDLKPSGSWAGGGTSGSFTYSYPIAVPPAASDLVPDVKLSYDSGSVDGQTASTQAQSSWVGDGWSTPHSFIEQSFVSCADSPEGSASPVATYDQCYDGPILNLSLNGSSTPLVWDAGKTVWKPEHDNGEVITHVTGSGNGTDTHDEDYWQVTTRDGTVYQFGRNRLPGWGANTTATNSVDWQPVYSAHSKDPCYKSTGFADSVCKMAYRWNLDYVTDVHGNAMSYYYKQDTNYYGSNKGNSDVSYIRDSHLDHIDYGFRDGNAYTAVPNQVVFGVSDRCVAAGCSPLGDSTKANWPDVPYDLICKAGTNCTSWSPSYFSTGRLTSITTYQSSTTVPVDSYALTQTMPNMNGGTATSPTLWLSSISHTGSDTGGKGPSQALTLPPVTFAPKSLNNRVDTSIKAGMGGLSRNRIDTITTETGALISVTYDRVNACPVPVPATLNPATNTASCYPVYWTPEGLSDPMRDWFNKYVVTRVTVHDSTGGAPDTETDYAYLGGAAWHYDDNEIVKSKYRTYGEFRGYSKVATLNGNLAHGPQTRSETTYYRGMSRNNSSSPATITDSAGGVHDDTNELAGSELETTTYLGDGGPVDHSTITSYWISAATATRGNRTGLPDLTANWVAPARTYSRQALTSGGTTTWRYIETDNSYDATVGSPTLGLPRYVYTHTVPADPAYDQCTSNTYAPVNTAKNLVGLIAETETDAAACGGFTQGSPPSIPPSLNTLTAPTSVSRPDQVVKDERAYYDDTNFNTTFPQPSAPSKGDVTMTRRAADWTAGAFTYQTVGRSTYDSYGRITDVFDANGNKTTTAYTMNSVGLTTGTTVTNPLDQKTTTTLDPARALTLTTTDPNGVVTTQRYDTLGRVRSVWLNSRTEDKPANYTYDYQILNDGITGTITRTMNEGGTYQVSTTIYDALMRPRQTQTITPQRGRMGTDTFYDTRGWTSSENNAWWDSNTEPNLTLFNPRDAHVLVNNADDYTYDGLGRVIHDESKRDAETISTTTTIYNGDRTTVIPPEGGVTTTTVTDPLDRTSQALQYTSPPILHTPANTFTGVAYLTGGTTTASGYGYDSHGNQAVLTDAQANTWTSTYNLLGQVVRKSDPDAGTSTTAYDANGNVTESTDARGKTTSATYDPLNRKTNTYAAPIADQAPSNRLASWVYDNSNNAVTGMTYPIGHVTTSTAYHDGAEYITQQAGFNVFGKSTGETITIPAPAGMPLATTYTFSHRYSTNTGLPTSDIYPQRGGLPAETINYGYTGGTNLPNLMQTVGGTGAYSDGTEYDAFGRVQYETLGGATAGRAYLTYTYDDHTGRLNRELLTHSSSTTDIVDDQTYKYDKVGNITKKTDTRLGFSTPETQCYRYDTLARLTAAWTATDDCAATPTPDNHSTVGDILGPNSTYWTTWDIDPLGNRTNQTQHDLTSTSDSSTTYTYDGNSADQPHTLTSTTTTGKTPGTTTYTYDAAGNMTSRNAAQGNQTLTWDDAGRLAAITGGSAGDTFYLYDADGNLLLQKDPGATTLYLPGEQITLNTATQTVTGTRYINVPGGATIIRTGSGTNYNFAITDQQGTPTLYLDRTAQNTTWRQYTPYGQPRGATVNLLDNRGFLNATEDTTTGLTHLGAREYDPAAGRFISIDPLQDTSDPQQWNGYSYANNSPITMADPSGAILADCMDFDCYGYDPHATGGNGGCPSGCGTEENKNWGKSHHRSSTRRKGGEHPRVLGHVVIVPPGVDLNRFEREWNKRRGDAFRAIANAPTDVEVLHQEYALAMSICGDIGGAACKKWTDDVLFTGYWETMGPLPPYEISGGEMAGLKGPKGNLAERPANPVTGEEARPECLNSFDGETLVLMADGSHKKIKDVSIGDDVLATDPQGMRTASGQVADKVVGKGKKELVRVVVSDSEPKSPPGTVIATSGHLFWNQRSNSWIRAGDLHAGDELLDINGRSVRVLKLIRRTRAAIVYNLTIANLHTYYVVVGSSHILVHNVSCSPLFKGEGWQHVLYEHVDGSPGVTPENTTFSNYADLDEIGELIQETAATNGRPNSRDPLTGLSRDGTVHRKEFDYPVGSRGETSVEVILNPDGSLRTAYPVG